MSASALSPAGLAGLGIDAAEQALLRAALQSPGGLFLICSPRRSGRSTSAYALLETLEAGRRSVATLEARPLRPMPHWFQAATDAPVTGARVLAALRADPDALLLDAPLTRRGARAMVAALEEGRLVLCVVPGARAHHGFAHFAARGVAPAALARHLVLALSQRLVPRLCPACSVPHDSPPLRAALARAVNSWLHGQAVAGRVAAVSGCAACQGTGVRGLVPLAELLEMNDALRSLASGAAADTELEHHGLPEGCSLWDRGLRLVAGGAISLPCLHAALRGPYLPPLTEPDPRRDVQSPE